MKPSRSTVVSEIRGILDDYDLGELLAFEQNERGYVNTSYAIETVKQGVKRRYFLRRYKSGIQEVEVQFEHSVINHLMGKNFDLIARVLPTKQGGTYIKKNLRDGGVQTVFYAVFEFLEGEDKYTCVDPHCSSIEIEDSAAVLADFHHAVQDLDPEGARFEPGILDLLPEIRKTAARYVRLSRDTSFSAYLRDNLSLITESCLAAEQYYADHHTSGWPEQVIHCDYHPGNLKFESGKVVALFDFDWSKVDLRSFDVALAIWYFFASWKETQDGILRLDESRLFLDKYQSRMRSLPSPNPLNQAEMQDLPMMIYLGNLYVLNWAVTDYYSKEFDEQEDLIWLQHSVNFTRWFDDSGAELVKKALAG